MANTYPQPVLVPTRPWPAIAAAALVAIAAIFAVTALEIWGKETHTPTIVSIMGFATALTASLITLVKVQQVGTQIDALHTAVSTAQTPAQPELPLAPTLRKMVAEEIAQQKAGTTDVS